MDGCIEPANVPLESLLCSVQSIQRTSCLSAAEGGAVAKERGVNRANPNLRLQRDDNLTQFQFARKKKPFNTLQNNS